VLDFDSGLFEESSRAEPDSSGRKIVSLGPFATESGFAFPSVEVAYQEWGPVGAPVVLVCHALSGDSNAVSWWSRLVGPGRAVDTEKYRVICTNVLGGCQGTTGPASLDTDGKRWGSRFPLVTIGDMVAVQRRLLAKLGIEKLHAVMGGSMGGMQALEWTRRYPGFVKKAFVTASALRHNAMQIGFNEVARQAIYRDPKFRGGDYPPDDAPSQGMAVGRMVGHLTYLSESALDHKFGRRFQDGGGKRPGLGVDRDQFEIESYLSYQGHKFTERFDPNSLIVVTNAIDCYDCDSLDGSTSEYLFTSFSSDWAYPSHQSEAAHKLALSVGCASNWVDISLDWGHDAFLLDGEIQGKLLRNFLAST